MIINKYLAALLSIALVVVDALVALPHIGIVDVLQLGVVAIAAIVTYLVPLLDAKWAGALKTGAAVLAAILSGVIPFIMSGGITPQQIALVLFAALQALAVEVGVAIRTATPA